jgi:hypothetical protein
MQPDGTKAVQCQKRTWRPQVKYDYQEIPTELDPSLFEKHGKFMARKKAKLPEREGALPYDPAKSRQSLRKEYNGKIAPKSTDLS